MKNGNAAISLMQQYVRHVEQHNAARIDEDKIVALVQSVTNAISHSTETVSNHTRVY